MQSGAPRDEGKESRTAAALAVSWRLEFPAGFQYQVLLRPLGANRVSVENAVRFSGVYELQQGRVVLVEASDPAEKGFAWEARGAEELALVAQPPVAKTGANYLGATLRRLPDEGQPIPRQRKGPPDAGDRRAQVVQQAGKPPAPEGETSADEANAARALQRIKAEYRLKKEPAYQGPVQYCLLLLGRNAETRLWLASDGKTLYVDRNGDGDLTQPGEAVPFKPDKDGGFASFTAERFPGSAVGAPTDRLHVAVRQRDWQNNKGGYWCVRARVEGRYPMYAFAHKFAHKPDEAPVIHLGGPLRLGLYELEGGRLVRGGRAELNAYVACHYPGVERAFVDADEWGRTGPHPVAEVRLPAGAPGAAPVALRVPLTQHC